jgi:hypothetical protein
VAEGAHAGREPNGPIVRLVLASLLVASCAESPETPFSRDGVSLTCPMGWKITDAMDVEGMGYTVSVEKDGFSSSGLAVVTWLKVPMEVGDYMDLYRKELATNIIYRSSNLRFTDDVPGRYGAFETLSCSYEASILGVRHRGALHVFKAGGRTFTVCVQEALEDAEKNRAGFAQIEASLAVAE